MASTPQSTHKTTTSTTSSTTSSAKSTEHSSSSSAPIQRESRPRGPSLDEDNDSGDDEWGVEIGNLIIDLDADVEKDEMKEKNDARNSNNNNSIKGSSGVVNTTNSQPSLLSNENILNSSSTVDSSESAKIGKVSASSSGNSSSQGSSKAKSKSKKSSKSSAMNKHSGVSTQGTTSSSSTAIGRNDPPSGNDSSFPMATSGRIAKPEASSSKTSRSYKKHGKNTNNSSDKKLDGGVLATKEGREKSTKSAKVSKHQNQGSVTSMSSAYSMAGASFTTPYVMGSLPAASNKGRRGNSPCLPSTASNISSHRSTTTSDAVTDISRATGSTNDKGVHHDRAVTTRANEAPVLSTAAHLGKHRKTISLPSPMKYPKPFGGHNSTSASIAMGNAPSPLAAPVESNVESVTSQNITGKRERISTALSAGNKKMKLEKEGKFSNNGMTPNDGDNALLKPTGGSPATFPGQLVNLKNEYKMTVGQQKLASHDAKEDKKSTTTRSAVTSSSSTMHLPSKGGLKNASNISSVSTEASRKTSSEFRQNNIPTPTDRNGADKRTIGTDTMYADVGVSTEPESLGPCEPGTSVNLNGIVWHETESGVLVVNVTWRNRSYVGTLLDATKHDWAPPRIPDVDSDTEYRVKSGRPKRHRGANGNASEGGRKGRKSALANNLDEYKCSPSSNKRRSAKMSESDAYSGNDGEICTTPSKSAKRARLSRTAAAKQAAQKSVNATAVKESSGDGTSGSGSSACSSPVFMECPYANCKKRYKDDSALKYHESHAHQGEELEKNGTEAESPPTDSPAGSGEGIPASDSSGSPSAENDQTAKESENNFNMETDSVQPSARTPFVVTQAQDVASEQFAPAAFPSPKQSSSMQNNLAKNISNNEEGRTRNERPVKSSSEFESSEVAPPEPTPVGDAISPYTLTDSQSNESISLKTPVQMKPPARSYGMSRPRPSLQFTSELKEHSAAATIAALEASSAVDNESAQAVQTLLQLQENSQDQLPGLTQYSQTSQTTAMTMPSQIDPITTPSSAAPSSSQSHSAHPSQVGQPDKFGSGGQAKPQAPSHTLAPTFRGHSKDGTPLPRMSVGVCSLRNQTGGQYVGGYSHGTVTASSTQERASHQTSTGLKTVKVKTVPIPTDPQQMLTPSSQSSGVQNQNSANSAKKQKRKKPKLDSGKSPTELPKPVLVNQATVRPTTKEDVPKPGQSVLDQTRVKQEHQHHSATHPAATHYRMQYESQFHGAKQTPSVVKSEPGSKPLPPHSLQQAYVHPTTQHPQRQQTYPHQEQGGRDQMSAGTGNKNNNNKLTPHGTPQQRHVTSPILHDKGESLLSREGRPRVAHVPPIQHGSSHSLPGSRSITPVDPYGQTRYRLSVPPPRDSATPTNPQTVPSKRRSSSKESMSPPPPSDARAHVPDLGMDVKKVPAITQRPGIQHHQQLYTHGLLNQFVPTYDLGTRQAQYMHDPRFQQHYENVIQQEIQKDQKTKEEKSEGHGQNPLRQKSTPSPTEHKHVRPKSPLRADERRESSPRDQPYPQHAQQIQHSNRAALGPQQVHAPRDSPVPMHGGYMPAPNKLGVGAPSQTVRGLSPRPQTTPPPVPGNRPARPNSETERYHRREPSSGERPQPVSRTPVTPSRKPTGEGHSEHRPSSPDLSRQGPPPSSVYASPSVPVQLPPGARTPVPYYTAPYQHALIDPRVSPYPFPAYAMFPTGAHFIHGHWPPGAAPPALPGGQEKTPSQSPHSIKSTHERPSSISRSPYRDEPERRPRADTRGRDSESFSSSKERRISEGPQPQIRKSTTPDPKAAAARNQSSDGNSGTVTPPMQRHLHTHHHIHEGFPLIPPHQYPYQMASAVMAGTEAAAAATLAQYPNRDLS